MCVHCGFCLQACPTYLALEGENDSPRGRLVLMRGLLDGEISPTDSVLSHIDRCLGCLGCESACPSGVPYGRLLEATRATLAAYRPIPRLARVVLGVFRSSLLRRGALAFARVLRWSRLPRLARRLPSRQAFPFAMLASTRPSLPEGRYRPNVPPPGAPRTALLFGCVMEGLYAPTNRATERVLQVNGYDMIPAPGQTCCGALHAHAGDAAAARGLAKRNIVAFEQSGAEYVVVNASGCGAAMKEYGHLLGDDAAWSNRATAIATRVRDVSELLAARGPLPGGRLPFSVTYDAPCHLQHAQRVVSPPLAVLAAIPGLRVSPLTDSSQCCGSAGIYNLVEPETSERVLASKLDHLERTGADLVVSGNPGCLMQIGAGLIRRRSPMRGVHLVDLLDASYAQAWKTQGGEPSSHGH